MGNSLFAIVMLLALVVLVLIFAVIAAGVMVLMTAIFDNAIIGFGLVDYDEALISGVRIGFAPVEDFAYTVAALLIIPALWHLMAAPARKTGP